MASWVAVGILRLKKNKGVFGHEEEQYCEKMKEKCCVVLYCMQCGCVSNVCVCGAVLDLGSLNVAVVQLETRNPFKFGFWLAIFCCCFGQMRIVS